MSEYELRLVTAGGALDEYLPDFVEAVVGPTFSDVGAISLDYKVLGLNYATLATEEREVALTRNGVEVPDGRFVLQDDDGDELDENAPSRKFSGRTAVWAYLQDGLVYSPDGSTTVAKQSTFSSATVGTIIRTLLQRAQTRGASSLIDYSSFSNTLDSAGASWTKVINIAYDPGVTILQVLQNLVDQGMCEVKTVGRGLYIYNPDTLTTDRTVQAEPLVLRAGRDFKDAPKRRSSRDVANVILIRGDNDVLRERTDATSLSARRRREQFVSQGGVSDSGTLNVIADTHLSLKADPRIQRTFGVVLTSESPRPFSDYFNGDYVFCDSGAGNERLRVRQISLTLKASGEDPDLALVLNDRMTELEVALTRKVQGITGGAALGGGSTAVAAPTTTDRLAPGTPAAPTLSSAAYVDGDGKTLAQLTISWSQVTTNSDGTAISDLGGYEVQYARVAGQWIPLGRTDAATTVAYMSSLPVGKPVDARVRAYDTNGNSGAWSALGTTTTASDATPPNTPSTPTVDGSTFLGTLRVTWDGKDSGGAAMPADFASLEVHASTVNNFTPSITAGSSTKIDEYFQAIPSVTSFQAAIGSVTYVKFVAVDKAGNRSTASAQGSATARAGVDADFASISAGKITAGTLSADVIVGARIKTANTGARVEINSAGFFAYDSGNNQTVGILASDGSATFTGTIAGANITGNVTLSTGGVFRTAASGRRVEIQTGTYGGYLRFYSGAAGEVSTGWLYVDGSTGQLSLEPAVLNSGSSYTAVRMYRYPSINAWLGLDSADIEITATNQIRLVSPNNILAKDLMFFDDGSYSSARPWLTFKASVFSDNYTFYADNVGSGDSATSRLWLDCPDGGEVTIGPRSGTATLARCRIRGGVLRLDATAQVWGLTSTTASAADLRLGAAGAGVARSTSSERYKSNITPLTLEEALPVLDLTAVRYRGNSDYDLGEEGVAKEHFGAIAEDADRLGLFELVTYDEQGRPDWLMYERLGALLLPIVKDLKNRIEALEAV